MSSWSEIVAKYAKEAKEIKEDYKDASTWLPFKAVEIRKVFNQEELEQAALLVDELQRAEDDNARRRLLLNKIDDYSNVIVKLLGLAGLY